MYSGGCLLGHCLKPWKPGNCRNKRLEVYYYVGHKCPSFPLFPSIAFSSPFKWSFPFSESLSHSLILYVWNNLQTFHKVKVWGNISIINQSFSPNWNISYLFNQKGPNDPLLKRLVLQANRRIAKYNQYYTLHYGVYCLVVWRLSIDRFCVSNFLYKLLCRYKDERR